MKKNNREREYDFTLVLTGVTELTDAAEDALFEAGCDDATLSIRSGQVYLTFVRRARTIQDAIQSAIQDVNKARIGAMILRIEITEDDLGEAEWITVLNNILELQYQALAQE